MPSDTNDVWIDSTFNEYFKGKEDVNVEIVAGDSNNIGNYSIPVIFIQEESELSNVNTNVSLQLDDSIVSTVNTSTFYYEPSVSFFNTSVTSFIDYYSSSNTVISGIDNFYVKYFTGFNVISGAIDSSINFISGLDMKEIEDIYTYFSNFTAISGNFDYWNNYTNFSGNIGPGGIPIPFSESSYDYTSEYFRCLSDKIFGTVDVYTDIFFAGWIHFDFNCDIYSSLLNYNLMTLYDVSVISGAVFNIDCNVYSVNSSLEYMLYDVYSSLVSFSYLNYDIDVTKGRTSNIDTDVYSANDENRFIPIDISLYSLKISNFSLSTKEYINVSGTISVDVTDDTCSISTDNTYMLINGIEVTVDFVTIFNGYRILYNPDDNFSSINGPTEILLHVENTCDNWLEDSFYVTTGVMIGYDNYINNGFDFGHNNEVLVRIEAEDMASCPSLDSFAWSFKSLDYINKDLSANLVCMRDINSQNSNISANIVPKSTAYFYGKEFEVIIKAKDFAGNRLDPFVLNYRIESISDI